MKNGALTIEEKAAYIRAILPLYPGGIPVSLLKVPEEVAPAVSCRVIFVSHEQLSAEERELLQKAIDKGMGLPADSVAVRSVGEASHVDEIFTTYRAEVVVALGPHVAELLIPEEKSELGAWSEVRGVPLICTQALSAVMSDVSRKKSFWEDLKKVMMRLNERKEAKR